MLVATPALVNSISKERRPGITFHVWLPAVTQTGLSSGGESARPRVHTLTELELRPRERDTDIDADRRGYAEAPYRCLARPRLGGSVGAVDHRDPRDAEAVPGRLRRRHFRSATEAEQARCWEHSRARRQ